MSQLKATSLSHKDNTGTPNITMFPDGTTSLSGVGGRVVGYQQGLWTPDFGSTAGVPVFTASARYGAWARVGNTVTLHGTIVVQTVTTAGTGNISLDNVPYRFAPQEEGGRGIGSCYAAGWTNNNPTFVLGNNANQLRIYTYGSSNLSSSVGSAALANGSAIYTTVTYQTDDTTWQPINGATVT